MAGGLIASDSRWSEHDFQDDAILVIINEHALNVLEHAGGLPFLPKLPVSPRPVVGEARGNGVAQSFSIHEGKHGDLACLGVGGDAGLVLPLGRDFRRNDRQNHSCVFPGGRRKSCSLLLAS